MSRTARLWKGAGPLTLTLGGLLLTGTLALGADPVPDQLVGLARQAAARGRTADARNFYREALKLDPRNAEARRALAVGVVRRVVRQDPAMPAEDPAAPADGAQPAVPPEEKVRDDSQPVKPGDATDRPGAVAPPTEGPSPADRPMDAPDADPNTPPPPPRPQATLENQAERDRVVAQQAIADIRDQIARARQLLASGEPDASLETIRLAKNALRTTEQLDDRLRAQLARDLDVEYRSTQRKAEILDNDRAEALRLQSTAEQRARTLEQLNTNEINVNALMTQFDTLMSEGQYNVLYNGGTGDIVAATAPFYDAQLLAQHARALDPAHTAPRAAVFTTQAQSFLAQSIGFEELKEFRYLITMEDVDRASVPFPDNQFIEYPDADKFRKISEKRIKRYESSDLVNRDPKTLAILDKLNQPISLPFETKTSLNDVLKYIKQATAGPNDSGIPIYVDPVAVAEHDIDADSGEKGISINLEGVPLKTSLRMMLRQLDLVYTVKDGLLQITHKETQDTQTERRVYPVADLAIIPRLPDGHGRRRRHGRRRHGRRWHGRHGRRWHGRHGRRWHGRHGWWHGRHGWWHGRHGRRHGRHGRVRLRPPQRPERFRLVR